MGREVEGFTNVDHELQDLKSGDPLLPPNANATRTLEIVPIHDHVNQQVQVDDDPLDRRGADQLSVTQECGGTVVVGVQERQGLLLEEQEDGIDQFDVFGQVVELNKSPEAVSTRIDHIWLERSCLHSTAE